VTTQRTAQARIRGSAPVRCKRLFSPQECLHRLWDATSRVFNEYSQVNPRGTSGWGVNLTPHQLARLNESKCRAKACRKKTLSIGFDVNLTTSTTSTTITVSAIKCYCKAYCFPLCSQSDPGKGGSILIGAGALHCHHVQIAFDVKSVSYPASTVWWYYDGVKQPERDANYSTLHTAGS